MTLAEGVYRLLLRLYPPQYRREYGELMATHFRDLLRDARHAGPLAVLRLWGRTLLDLLTTVPAEHLEAAMHDITGPLPWGKALLAALPGLALLVSALLTPIITDERIALLYQAAFLLIAAIYIAIGVAAERRLAVWTLPALGFLTAQLLLNMWGAILFRVLLPVLGLALLPVLGGLIWQTHRRARTVFWAWLLLSLAVALGLFGELWFNPALLQQPVTTLLAQQVAGVVLLLVFVALGLPVAWRYGSLAGLFVTGTFLIITSYRLDPTYGLWDSPWGDVVSVAEMLSFLVAAPLLALRARSERGRFAAIMMPSAVGLVAAALVKPLMRGTGIALPLLAAVQLVLVLAFALVLYANTGVSRGPAMADTRKPSPEGA